MVEVFKTNVNDGWHANLLIGEIQTRFAGYMANFDLEDCDRILRVKNHTGLVQSFPIIRLLKKMGFDAQILEDEKSPPVRIMMHSTQYHPVVE